MKAKPQGRLEGTVLGSILKTKFAVIGANWVFQGMRYMNKYEISLKLFLDILIAALLINYIFNQQNLGSAIVISLVCAHTINWIINGHIFVLLRYITPVPKTEKHFEYFIKKLKNSASNWKSIDGVAIYGSYCRGTLHELSDLDVRVITTEGNMNSFFGAIFCFYQRFIAFISVFPLDIYCCENMVFLDQLREDEIPIILLDHSGRLAKKYNVTE